MSPVCNVTMGSPKPTMFKSPPKMKGEPSGKVSSPPGCMASRWKAMNSSASAWRLASLVAPPQHLRWDEVKSVGLPYKASVSTTTGKLRYTSGKSSPKG